MSETLRFFRGPAGDVAVALPFDLDAVLADWAALRPRMARELLDGFERDEWAYLIQFLEKEHLLGAFRTSFGEPATDGRAKRPAGGGPSVLARPRGPVAVWLPSNVSLLGPLVLILLSVTGNPILLKGASRAEDLTGAFLAYAREHLPDGALRAHLRENVRFEVFDREDARNADFAREARVRIVFGTDAAARAVEALAHPLDSVGFAFVDRRSEAWVSPEVVDDALVETLVKVFAIYGQAGCTSPRRVVLLGAGLAEARALRDRMLASWPRVVRARPPQHVASSSVMGRQWAAALGWDAELAANNGAVLAAGERGLEPFAAPMALPVVGASLEEALGDLPENIQTIGHAVADPDAPSWLALVARARAKRFVPLARMHHFGPVWDGTDFWRQTFEQVEVGR